MNFAAWLAKISDFVSLGKILTDGGPGMILAASLFVIGTRLLGLPIFVLDTHDVPRNGLGSIAARKSTVYLLEDEVAAAEREKAWTDARIGVLESDAKVLDTQIAATEAQSVALGRTAALKLQREGHRRELALLLPDRTRADVTLQAKKRQLEQAQKELAAVIATQNITATNLFDNALSHLVGLTFVGYILGTLLNPLNRVLFLEWGLGFGRVKQRVFEWALGPFRAFLQRFP
jgi:hypothetical protein